MTYSFLRSDPFRGSILSSASRLFIFAGLTRICILGHQTKCTPTNATANWNENGICVHFKSNGIFCFTQTGFGVESETPETHIVTICGQTEDLVSTLICHKCEKRFVIVAHMLKTRWLLFHALIYVIYIHGVLGQDSWGWGSGCVWGGGGGGGEI